MAPQITTVSTSTIKKKVKLPEMLTIPEGDFLMGTSDEQVDYLLLKREEWAEEWYAKDLFMVEQPQHKVHLPAFQIARVPVTNADYYIYVWETGARVPRNWIGFKYNEEEIDHPVVGINRIEAVAYCNWLSQKLKQDPPHNYRLPTEAEWERAARGDDERIYPWGNDFDPWRCNTDEAGKRGTCPVGSYSPSGDSPFGVNDMVGNVWEWTSTVMRAYPFRLDDGRDNIDSPDVCVIRGGSWYYSRKLARCSAREGVLPTYISNALGLRLARTP